VPAKAIAKSATPADHRPPATHINQPKGTIVVQRKSLTHHLGALNQVFNGACYRAAAV